MKPTLLLLGLLFSTQILMSQKTIIQDTFYYKSGEMIVEKMYEERNMDLLVGIYVKTPEGKSKKIKVSKVQSYVRGGTNERYVRLKVPKNWFESPSFEKAFFREMLKDTNGISVYWVDYTQPQINGIYPMVLPVQSGLIIGVGYTYKDVGQSYYYLTKKGFYRIDRNEKSYQKLLKKIADEYPNIMQNVENKVYTHDDIWKFAKDVNAFYK